MKPTRVILSIFILSFGFIVLLGVIGSNYDETATEPGDHAGTDTDSGSGDEMPGYLQSCVSCHGADLTGGFGPNLHQLDLSKEEMVDIITNGKGQMPGNLISGKEEQAAEYLLSIQE